MKLDDLGKSLIFRKKDQALLMNRLFLYFESYFPNLFYFLKKMWRNLFLNNLIIKFDDSRNSIR